LLPIASSGRVTLGAAFLCADLGLRLEDRADHAACIGHWVQVLKYDKRAIFSAAAHAQRAADYLYGLQDKREKAQEAAYTEITLYCTWIKIPVRACKFPVLPK
jgi:antirestriction protein ArdC